MGGNEKIWKLGFQIWDKLFPRASHDKLVILGSEDIFWIKRSLKGCIVTIDARGCQKEIAKKIVENEGDYVFSLKGNQGSLHVDIKLAFDRMQTEILTEKTDVFFETVDADHGHIEVRKYWITENIEWLVQAKDWPGFRSIGLVESTREIGEKKSVELRYFITSLAADAKVFGNAVRSHWGIENSLHWVLDVTFREDQNTVKGNAALNLGQLRHIALNVLKQEERKRSVREKRKNAGWDNDYLKKILENHVL